MEIVKIRMQVAGEINRSMARSERTIQVVRELGFFGLYKVMEKFYIQTMRLILFMCVVSREFEPACLETSRSQ